MGHRRLRAVALAAAALATSAGSAAAATELNIVPHGQSQPGVDWLSVPGVLPADAQARMYDRLTPLYRSVGPAQLVPSEDGTGFFKSARLIPDPDDPSFLTDQTVAGTALGRPVQARIRRDRYGVPSVYSATDDGVTFGAGYVVGNDRSLLLQTARTNGIASLIDLPGVPGINLVLGLYDFQPSQPVLDEVTRQQEDALRAAGPEGVAVLHDIDVYLAGLNAWRAERSATTKPFTRTDIFALNGIKAQFLGEGGGAELANEALLGRLRQSLGRKVGGEAYADLRQREDPEHPRTGTRRATYGSSSVADGRGVVHLRPGSFSSSAVALPGAPAARSASPEGDTRASNVLMVSGKRSASGRPVFVGGPQIGYNYPGLTLEMGLYGPSEQVRGATSAPFPGYMLIGRGQGFGFSLTSAGADIKDTYAERLCGSDTRYRHGGRCRTMQTVDAGTISKGGATVRVRFRRTVHGPVVGYARDSAGRRVALAVRRSSAGRETNDQLLFRRLTRGQVKTPAQLDAAAALTPQTFNSFLVTERDIAYFTSGRLPVRPKGVNPDLPVDGQGAYEWQGYLPSSSHPREANPSTGTLVNWNNEAAPGWPASDERFSQGPDDRVRLLTSELDRTARHTPASVQAAENAAATQDPRGKLAWPIIRAVLRRGSSPSRLATEVVAQLDGWAAGGASWRDGDVDGTIDSSGPPAIQAVWTRLADAAMCRRLTLAGCQALRDRMGEENAPPGGLSSGWQGYLDKDLRRLLGRPVRGAYALRYCGRGDVAVCARDLWAAIDTGARRAAVELGGDPAAWRLPESSVQLTFSPLPLATMQFTNRPSGIQQVLAFDAP